MIPRPRPRPRQFSGQEQERLRVAVLAAYSAELRRPGEVVTIPFTPLEEVHGYTVLGKASDMPVEASTLLDVSAAKYGAHWRVEVRIHGRAELLQSWGGDLEG